MWQCRQDSKMKEGRGLTEEVDEETAVREAAGGSAEEGTAVGEVDGEAEAGGEVAGVGVGVSEVENGWALGRPACHHHEEKSE